MIFKQLILPALLAVFLASAPVYADSLELQDAAASSDVKPNLPQPYVVKTGDTLWDIANHFFKNPWKWLKIWEQNLHITNPDLIYPGNEIWFDGSRLHMGGLTTVQPRPQVIVKPVERMEAKVDSSLLLTALMRQDLIQPDQIQGVGHVLDSQENRINYGVHDRVYMKLNQPAKAGSLFDVFRSTDTIRDTHSGNAVGILVEHLGQIRVSSEADGIYRGVVVKAFEEISRGDRLKPAKVIDPHILPTQPEQALSGSVMYIRNNAQEAGQNQVVGINLGLNNGLKAGMVMSVRRAGRLVEDQVTGEPVLLPQEPIGTLLVLVPQAQVSIALITRSTAPINIGDAVQSATAQ
ncbi:MAG: LysM peptidoglycan-binding domain-containing protein [Mariprofundus sp.]